jgi:hypothetical protein
LAPPFEQGAQPLDQQKSESQSVKMYEQGKVMSEQGKKFEEGRVTSEHQGKVTSELGKTSEVQGECHPGSVQQGHQRCWLVEMQMVELK